MSQLNPASYVYTASPDPLATTHRAELRDASTGAVYATEQRATAPSEVVTMSFAVLRAQVLAAGRENVALTLVVIAEGPGGTVSVPVEDDATVTFIDIAPPTDVDVPV